MSRDQVCEKFLETLTFDLYPVQEEAILAWFGDKAGVMVCAPTGMGKTLIAHAALFEALSTGKRAYYTTPLIALTDQKFREFQDQAERWGFRREDVGLITGNRRVNPDARVRVVVAEILLNHLLGAEEGIDSFDDVDAVVMDEFHSFNDAERGVVWELSLVLLPRHVRVMLLSATVGNPFEFADWLNEKHGRRLEVVMSAERRVPLEFHWVEDKLLTEQLMSMVGERDEEARTPALVFCFNREECWEVAEKLKGLALVGSGVKGRIETFLDARRDDLSEGAGPKLRQMLIRGVGVHHAGVLPKHKHLVEQLFNEKLVPIVACTETLAAGINLPARSVVISALLKGKPREKKLIPSATAHQIFGRAGRPQFDTRGYVYSVAHDDDVRIVKWKERFEKIDPNSKDPVILRMRREMERKRPTRRKTEQYWTEGQFRALISAGPSKLYSLSMIPYQVLIFLLCREGSLRTTREFLGQRFAAPAAIDKFQQQLDAMLNNLAAFGYLSRAADSEQVTVHDSIQRLRAFRSVDPLYGAFLAEQLGRSDFQEKLLALESVLEMPRAIERKTRIPRELAPGPLQTETLGPLLLSMGLMAAPAPAAPDGDEEGDGDWDGDGEEDERQPTLPEMLKLLFDAKLASPEPVIVQPKWAAGAAFQFDCEFFRFVRAHDLVKQEGLVLRHLLRLVILAEEFLRLTEDPDYLRICEQATRCCQRVDPEYTDRFLADAHAFQKLAPGAELAK